MEQAKKDKLMNCSTLDELLNVEYGEPGTESRKQFDDEAKAFCLTQSQLDNSINQSDNLYN
jgi:hypothetical protein